MKPMTILATLSCAALVRADFYANFFNDDNCSEGGGQGVNVKNPGCLTQNGRRSVYIPNVPELSNKYGLVYTNDSGECTCQNRCYEFTATGFCHRLEPNVKSYRFLRFGDKAGQCDPDNC